MVCMKLRAMVGTLPTISEGPKMSRWKQDQKGVVLPLLFFFFLRFRFLFRFSLLGVTVCRLTVRCPPWGLTFVSGSFGIFRGERDLELDGVGGGMDLWFVRRDGSDAEPDGVNRTLPGFLNAKRNCLSDDFRRIQFDLERKRDGKIRLKSKMLNLPFCQWVSQWRIGHGLASRQLRKFCLVAWRWTLRTKMGRG